MKKRQLAGAIHFFFANMAEIGSSLDKSVGDTCSSSCEVVVALLIDGQWIGRR
jgi:hypothetical protein